MCSCVCVGPAPVVHIGQAPGNVGQAQQLGGEGAVQVGRPVSGPMHPQVDHLVGALRQEDAVQEVLQHLTVVGS